ncbi:MAG TPA: hypothetical protein VLL74_01650, partial [Methanoregula sp.]|nr:hypothetical protein [Methanoregula sp.]
MAEPLFFQRCRTALTPEKTAGTLGSGFFFLLLLCPLIVLSLDLLHAVMSGAPDMAAPVFISPRRLGLLATSIGFAGAVAGTGIVFGILFISALFRLSKTQVYSILLLLLALAGIPPYIHALTWSEVLSV